MEQFEFEDIFTGHLVQTSIAMSRDISNYKRLLRLQSNLTSNVSRDGVYTTSLGNLLQGHTILIVRYSFLISNQSWPSVCLKPLPPVLLQQTLTKCLSSSVSQSSFNYSKTTVGFPQSSLLQPEEPQLSSQKRYFIPPIIFMAVLWIHSNRYMSFLCWGHQSWIQYSRWGLTRMKRINHLP